MTTDPAGPAQPGVVARPPRVRAATLALTAVCLFWGSTFLLMKQGTAAIRDVFGDDWRLPSGALFLTVRFGLAALLMPVLIPASVKNLNGAAWRLGFWLSLVFGAGFLLQVYGLTQPDVPPSQSAFLTSLFVVATPVISSLIHRRLPAPGVLVGVLLATIGAAFIKGLPEGGLSAGAWATLACAVVFGGHIVMTDHATKRAHPMALTFTMLVYSTIWTGLTLVIAPEGASRLSVDRIGTIFASMNFVIPLAICTVFATVLALSILNHWQKEVSPSRAAVIYTSEPVFATLISLAATQMGLAHSDETVTPWLFFGAGMIVLANLAAEFLRRRS